MRIVDEIFAAFGARGGNAYTLGEPITQTQHALQCADLARMAGAADPLVAAALLHDVGHLIHDLDPDAADHGIDTVHERVGADFLSPRFGPDVAEPVRLHVDAKRYLCATRPDYFQRLSPASVHSLALQGGPMSAREVAAFGANPRGRDAVALRHWDEAAKVVDAQTRSLEDYRALLTRLSA